MNDDTKKMIEDTLKNMQVDINDISSYSAFSRGDIKKEGDKNIRIWLKGESRKKQGVIIRLVFYAPITSKRFLDYLMILEEIVENNNKIT